MARIPVISANFSGMEKNSGFRLSVPLLMKGIQSLIYGDLLSQGRTAHAALRKD